MNDHKYAMEMECDLKEQLEQLRGYGNWRGKLSEMRIWVIAEHDLGHIDDTEKQILMDLLFDWAELLHEEETEYEEI